MTGPTSQPSPTFSIVSAVYNVDRYLGDFLSSLERQSYGIENLDIILVDDGSTDDSREIIASYGSRIIPILKENGGQASAFNAGFVASKG